MSTTVSVSNTKQTADPSAIPQYSLPMIIFMFAWPLAWWIFWHFVISRLAPIVNGNLATWGTNLIWLLGNGVELVAGIIILRREGYRLTPRALRDRINWRFPDRWWKWVAGLGIFVVSFALVNLSDPLVTKLATVPGFIPPEWYAPDMHPFKEVNTLQDAFPDVNLAGNYAFFLFFNVILGFIGNIIGEGLYYQGVLLPKMRGIFGKWTWLANGIGFTLKHGYQSWTFARIWSIGPALALVAGPLGSLPLSMLLHYVGNFMLLIAMIPAVFGGG